MEPAPEPEHELRRSRQDRVLTGVLGGAADFLHVDSILLRIAAVIIFVIQPWVALVAYGIAWMLMPDVDGSVIIGPDRSPLPGEEEPKPAIAAETGTGVASRKRDPGPARWALGLVLIAVGAAVLLETIVPNVDAQDVVFAGLLIVVGVMLIAREVRN